MKRSMRSLWIALQLLLVIPFMFAGAMLVEMTFAEPGRSYRADAGELVECEALAPRSKRYNRPRCASFGSMETNPGGYAVTVVSLVSLGALLWWTSRPRRGLSWSK